MISSIRRFLLVYVLIAIGLITTLSGVADYYLSKNDIQAHMDALLEQMGLSFASIISTHLTTESTDLLEKEIYSMEDKSRYLFFLSDNHPQNVFFSQSKYYFQLWNEQGNLLLYSPKANTLNLNVPEGGLNTITIDGHQWRVFKLHDPKTGVNYIVGERYTVRDQLLHRIALNNFYIMLSAFPLFIIIIWLIVGLGLKSVHRITNELSNRAPTYLEPVHIMDVPIEIRPLIKELNKLFEKLHDAFEREKRFAADAAHELRTPLAALKTQVQIILKTVDAEERQYLLANLIPAVDRLVHIVQQLLVLSRIVPESNTIYDTVEVNLPKISAEIVAQLAPMAIEKNIEISQEAPKTAMIRGNLTGISILVRNLVDNAIRYTPENGNVTVSIHEKGNHVNLSVRDTGPGIPEELQSRVFERFYRIFGNNVSGSGLGLAIVQQIAQLHQATIKLSTPEKGTGLIVTVSFLKAKGRRNAKH